MSRWQYQSYVSLPADIDRTTPRPTVRRPALIAAPWTRPTVMECTTTDDGSVTGTANGDGIKFRVSGTFLQPETAPLPAHITHVRYPDGTVKRIRFTGSVPRPGGSGQPQ